ncbi:MAG: hypothetical protein ABJM06_06925 [Gilvibacter sp.]
MLVEASLLKNRIARKIETAYGKFYFFENFIISEFNEGVIVTYEVSAPIINEAKKHYGKAAPIAYISNRVNSYSVNPTDWLRFYKENNFIVSMAVIAHNHLALSNVMLERCFVRCKMKKFSTLLMAASWSQNNVNKFKDRIITDLKHIA